MRGTTTASTSSTVIAVGTPYPDQKLAMGARLVPRASQQLGCASRHGLRAAADRVGHVVVPDRIGESSPVERAGGAEIPPGGGRHRPELREGGMRRGETGLHLLEGVVGQLAAERLGKRAQDRPILARIAGREDGAAGAL